MSAIRTTFSLDPQTIAAVRMLAERWQLSQAGVIRRAVKEAASRSQTQLTPREAIARMRQGEVPMDRTTMEEINKQLRSDRRNADAQRS